MSIEGIAFALLMLVAVVALIAMPVFSRDSATDPAADKQRERLQLYYERVLRNIRDLDEDYALGKLDESAYQVERETWAERGVQVLKALDSLAEHPIAPPTVTDDAAVDRAIDDAIEAAIRNYRAKDRVSE